MVENSLPQNTIYTKQIEFVTVAIEKIEGETSYNIFTFTEKKGIQFIACRSALMDALRIAEEQEKDIIERIKIRRKGKPTMRQVFTLYNLKVSIPFDFTFGDASDALNIHLPRAQEESRERQRAKRAASRQKRKRPE